jgi:hypothetical protein
MLTWVAKFAQLYLNINMQDADMAAMKVLYSPTNTQVIVLKTILNFTLK